MTRQPQGASEIVIYASPEKIWALLADSTRLRERVLANLKRVAEEPQSAHVRTANRM